jgi:nitrile hydratase accessory protein
MSGSSDPSIADPDAPAAPPRSNGELVFEEPWESRAFGVAVALHDSGLVDFEAFRVRLIEEIGAWEAAHKATVGHRYYERWLTALERTLFESGLVESDGLAAARAALELEWAHDHT